MFSGLLASARDLRNPLTVGYSVLITLWLLAGEAVNDAALGNRLGRRLASALESMGDGTVFALVTFIAAMLGSLLWNIGLSRLVRFLSARSDHPDWEALIEEARAAVREYEEYKVVTHKGAPAGRPSAFDERHNVPSQHHALYLQERVEERERKAAEMSFRVTLAISLIPASMALGIEGGGLWWLSLIVIPILWFDVAFLKHTTLRSIRRYKLEDLESRLEGVNRDLADAKDRSSASIADAEDIASHRAYLERLEDGVTELEGEKERLLLEESRRSSKLFALLEG